MNYSLRFRVRKLKHRLTRAGTEDGCCSCGGPRHDWVYFGAMGDPDRTSSDWSQCDACHNDRSVLGTNMRALRHERVA